jgi:hypothetical protein
MSDEPFKMIYQIVDQQKILLEIQLIELVTQPEEIYL